MASINDGPPGDWRPEKASKRSTFLSKLTVKNMKDCGQEESMQQHVGDEEPVPDDKCRPPSEDSQEKEEGVSSKKLLEFSDQDELDDEQGEDSDDGQKEASYKTMEKKSRRLDQKRQKLEHLGKEEERNTILANVREDTHDYNEPSDLSSLKQRIQNTVLVLNNFSSTRDPAKSRKQYISQLTRDLCLYYGYGEYLLEDKLFPMFTISELIEFLEASDIPRPLTIRTNSLKTKRRDLAQALIHRGVNVDPIDRWSKVGLQVFESSVPIGATPEYLSGHYMLQAAASFLPVLALDPRQEERILDMCAAPGGKTTYVAQLMRNTGCLFSNDISKDRQKATAANIHRLGIKNAVVTMVDGRKFPSVLRGFDRVLLDAPCSGTGVVSKDPSVKVSKTEADFRMLTHVQKELILAAIDATDACRSKDGDGGIVVYSTCSVCVEENEQVVQYALEKRPNVVLVDTGLPFGKDGFTAYKEKRFSPTMKLARRFYPHMHNLDGFFVAKLKKTSNLPPSPSPSSKVPKPHS